MGDGAYVVRRGTACYFRRRLPPKAVNLCERPCLIRSLRTDQIEVGRFLAAALALGWGYLIARLEVATSRTEAEASITEWFNRELDRVWRQYRTGELTRRAVAPGTRPTSADARRLLGDLAEMRSEDLEAEFADGDFSSAEPHVRDIVGKLSEPFDEHDQRFAALAKTVMFGLWQIEQARLSWADKDV